MRIYYLNSKSLEYASEVMGVDIEELKKMNNKENNDFIYIPKGNSGVDVLCNFAKDDVIVVDKEDNIEQLKKEYNIKGNVEIGDMFIVNSSEKYIVKPLDTLCKIADTLGVDKEYLINKNNLKTEKVFVGQILLI